MIGYLYVEVFIRLYIFCVCSMKAFFIASKLMHRSFGVYNSSSMFSLIKVLYASCLFEHFLRTSFIQGFNGVIDQVFSIDSHSNITWISFSLWKLFAFLYAHSMHSGNVPTSKRGVLLPTPAFMQKKAL